jgi:redox-sensing transcriptional repressor
MGSSANIPDIVVGRLPIYLRALSFMGIAGQEITSSAELAEKLGISSAQIRKDLSHFGEFGKQGTGYRISHLQAQLRKILKVDREWAVAVIGVGDLGHALVRYGGFGDRGFHIVLALDKDPIKIGEQVGELIIQDIADLPELIKRHSVQVAMLTVPAKDAQAIAELCVEAGIKAILNYAPINLTLPEEVHIQYTDPVTHLQRMTYYL